MRAEIAGGGAALAFVVAILTSSHAVSAGPDRGVRCASGFSSVWSGSVLKCRKSTTQYATVHCIDVSYNSYEPRAGMDRCNPMRVNIDLPIPRPTDYLGLGSQAPPYRTPSCLVSPWETGWVIQQDSLYTVGTNSQRIVDRCVRTITEYRYPDQL